MKKYRNKYVFFFDFDNTITGYDILDDIIERFSKDDRWKELERKWVNGEIGSRECLDGQIRGISVSRRSLDRYLSGIKIDPAFKKILAFCSSNRIKKYILSDNFEYILKGILRSNGIKGLRVYCNKFKFSGSSLIPRFPYLNKKCHQCAHCKKGNLVARAGRNALTVYVGDGLSDICPAKRADVVFAKGRLREYFDKKGLSYIPFGKLSEVYGHLKKGLLNKRSRG